MSALPMLKTCANCSRRFTYNPSIGDFGSICKHCGRTTDHRMGSNTNKSPLNILTDIFKR